MIRRIALLLTFVLLSVPVFGECGDQTYKHRELRYHIVGIAGAQAQVKDVLVFTERCHYLWHGTEGTYTFKKSVVTFYPSHDNNAPYSGSARMNEDRHLFFKLGDSVTLELAPKQNWRDSVCPFWPFC